jgi:hypothetical protein
MSRTMPVLRPVLHLVSASWFVMVLVSSAGCGSSAVGVDSTQPDSGAGAVTPDSGPAGLTDKDYCDRACATLIGCGVAYDASCSAGCQIAPVFLACTKASANDCNALALCAFRQGAAAACGPTAAGVPSGTGTCAKAAECEYLCGAQNAGAACSCACWAALAPSKAINLLINNQCATAACAATCGPGGNGPACNACFTSGVCAAQSSQCAAQ